MDNNIVTLGYLKQFTKGVLKLNKNIANTSDDIIVTYEDIINGVYYPYFKDSTNPKSIISGLYLQERDMVKNTIDKESLSMIFPKIINIEITCDSFEMSPCGETKELTTFAYFNIMQRFHNGEQLIKKLSCEINPILRKQDKKDTLFTLDGHNCTIGENITQESRKTIITASYAYKNEIKNASIELIQKKNDLSDWIFSHNTTDSLEISSDNTLISKNGGSCTIIVKRNFTKHYYKVDSCGNKVIESTQSNNLEDISKICHYTSTNNSVFIRSSNIISVDKQPIGGKKRHCIVNVEYDGCNASLTIEQEEGSSFKYTYSLLFADDSLYSVKTMNNSIASSFIIKLKSTKNMIVEDELYSSIPSYDLNFVKYDNWYNVDLLGIDDDGFISVKFIILNNNESKISDRETEVEIYNSNDVENRIKLLIRQPKNKCLKTVYDLFLEGERYFTYDTIKRSKIALKPLIFEHYEDGSIVEINNLPNDYKVILKGKSSDDSVLKMGNLIKVDFDGNHEMKPKYFDVEVDYDVTLSLSAYINDNNGFRITDIKCFNILLKGNDVIRYVHEFYPLIKGDKNNISFDYNDINEREFYIISKEHKLVNEKSEYNNLFVPFEMVGEINNFNVYIKHGETIIVKPKNINESKYQLNDTLTFIQEGSNKEIIINLVQNGKPKETYKDVELTVSIHKENIEEDLWFEMVSKLYITNIETNNIVYEIPLSQWWLCSDSDIDDLYSGIITLKLNNSYNFKIDEIYMSKHNEDEELFKIKLNETYLIEEDDEGIDLMIEI